MFHGDAIRAETLVRETRETGNGERGVVTLGVGATSQDDTLVCSFDRIALVERRPS